MRLLEFREQIPVETPLGPGMAIIGEFEEWDNHWTVVLDESRAIVTFAQNKLKVCKDYTRGRGMSDEEMRNILKPNAPQR